MSISFGVGPVGCHEELNEERIREAVEKINAETKAAGPPWWAGVFNPEIVKLAEIKRGTCNCAAEEPESAEGSEAAETPAETPEETPEETPAVKRLREMEEQRERISRADELVIQAIRVEVDSMETLARKMTCTDATSTLALEYARNIAEAGNTVARLRGSMSGAPFYGYGCV